MMWRLRARRGDAQSHPVQLVCELPPKPGELCDDPVHVWVDARSELEDRRVRLRGGVRRELAREAREHIVARLGQRPVARFQQHDLLLDPERIPPIKLVVPARPPGETPTRPIAEPADRVEI